MGSQKRMTRRGGIEEREEGIGGGSAAVAVKLQQGRCQGNEMDELL